MPEGGYGLDHTGAQEPQRRPVSEVGISARSVLEGGLGYLVEDESVEDGKGQRPEALLPESRRGQTRLGQWGQWTGFQETLRRLRRQREKEGLVFVLIFFLLGSLADGGDLGGDGECGFRGRGNSHVSGRYLGAILEDKQVIIGSTGENFPAGGAYLSVSGCELS